MQDISTSMWRTVTNSRTDDTPSGESTIAPNHRNQNSAPSGVPLRCSINPEVPSTQHRYGTQQPDISYSSVRITGTSQNNESLQLLSSGSKKVRHERLDVVQTTMKKSLEISEFDESSTIHEITIKTINSNSNHNLPKDDGYDMYIDNTHKREEIENISSRKLCDSSTRPKTSYSEDYIRPKTSYSEDYIQFSDKRNKKRYRNIKKSCVAQRSKENISPNASHEDTSVSAGKEANVNYGTQTRCDNNLLNLKTNSSPSLGYPPFDLEQLPVSLEYIVKLAEEQVCQGRGVDFLQQELRSCPQRFVQLALSQTPG